MKIETMRIEVRYKSSNELINSCFCNTIKEAIAFIKNNEGNYPCSRTYRKFIITHINKHDFIIKSKRK